MARETFTVTGVREQDGHMVEVSCEGVNMAVGTAHDFILELAAEDRPTAPDQWDRVVIQRGTLPKRSGGRV